MSMLKRATNPSKQAMVGLDVGGGDTMCPLGVRPPLLRISHETWWTRLLLFHRQIIRLRRRYNYEAYRIGNMDETAIYLDMPGDSTLDETGTRSVLIRTTGHDKDKVTVMLAALGDGTKIAPLMIFKGVRPPKNIVNGGVVAMSRNGWNMKRLQRCG